MFFLLAKFSLQGTTQPLESVHSTTTLYHCTAALVWACKFGYLKYVTTINTDKEKVTFCNTERLPKSARPQMQILQLID